MGVVCKQTMVLNECDNEYDKFGSVRGKKSGAFLNYSLSQKKASVNLTFTEDLNFLSAALCFNSCGKTRLFNIVGKNSGDSANGENVGCDNANGGNYGGGNGGANGGKNLRAFEFDFSCETDSADINNGESGIAALVFINGEPKFFACRGYKSNRAGGERRVFKELNEFYEENNKKGGCGYDEQKASLFCGEKIEGESDYVASNTKKYTADGSYCGANGGETRAGGANGSGANGGEYNCGTNDGTNCGASTGGASILGSTGGEKVEYDDDAIASVNYYAQNFSVDADSCAAAKIPPLKNSQVKIPLHAPESFCGGGEVENDLQNSQNAFFNGGGFSAQPQKTQEYAARGVAGGDNCGENSDFFKKIESQIESLFRGYPAENALSAVVPESRWARVCYGENKFYVVGVVYKGGNPRYIAYGVAGDRFSAPAGFTSNAVFLPASLFERENRGFWCMLQNAQTGETQSI